MRADRHCLGATTREQAGAGPSQAGPLRRRQADDCWWASGGQNELVEEASAGAGQIRWRQPTAALRGGGGRGGPAEDLPPRAGAEGQAPAAWEARQQPPSSTDAGHSL